MTDFLHFYHVETFFQLTVCQCGRFFLHKHRLWYLWQIWGMTKTEQILKKVNCIWRNETGKSSNASSFSETVYCLGSSAAQTQNFFAFAPILILLTISWYPYWNLLSWLLCSSNSKFLGFCPHPRFSDLDPYWYLSKSTVLDTLKLENLINVSLGGYSGFLLGGT